jgi:2-hydroxycyclohexanecarboxyl-CoA dehydrogenase
MEGLTLKDRVALVTGGAGGIGSQIVAELSALGAVVGVCDVNHEQAKSVAAATERAVALSVDLSDADSVSAMIQTARSELGRVDVLVNNAGWDSIGPFVDSSPQVWDRLIAINLRAPIQLTHAFLPGMLEAGWGRVVFISSDAARVGSTGEAVYAACKSGQIGFAKTIARETARHGVTSNVVCPGPTQTPLLEEIAAGNAKLVDSLRRGIPVGRLGEPRDVAGVVAFVCSERAEYLTGQTISVSGGLTMV